MAFDLDDDELRAIRKSKGLDDGLYEEKAKLVSQIATNFGIDFTEAKMMIEQSLMNFGKEFSMSEADEMFEKIGFHKEEVEDTITGDTVFFVHQYRRFDGEYDETISFNDSTKLMFYENLLFNRPSINIFEPELLQAINLKCQELGWLE